MLETLHNYFGFTGSLLVAFISFIFLIFWIAGVAGICSKKRPAGRQAVYFTLAILVPPYPVFWLITDMIQQSKELKRL
jgi:hypothetical protein